MKLRRAMPLAAALVAAAIITFLVYWLLGYGFDALMALVRDWKQFSVAVIAAAVMSAVGFRLTMGAGNLANAGQYEKIAVWAALLLSVVSAITTSLGLLLVLSANPQTGALLMVAMSLLLGLGIQLSMLMYALRIGDGLRQLSPVAAGGDDEDAFFEGDQPPRRRFSLTGLVLVLLMLAVGVAMFYGATLLEILGEVINSVYSDAADARTKLLGPVLVVLALLLAVSMGLIPRPATAMGLVMSLAIYCTLLLFSSGFGYLSYFLVAQSEQVQAVDRDHHIKTETPALVRRIREAATEDVRESLLQARSGKDYQDLSDRIDKLSRLFVENRAQLVDQVRAQEARREEIIAQRNAAAAGEDQAKIAVGAAELKVEQAKLALDRAEESKERNLPILNADLAAAEKEKIDAAAGRDRTGIPVCGPICREAERRVRQIRESISALDADIQRVQADLSAAEIELASARRSLEDARNSATGISPDEAIPPVIVDRASFTTPRNEYNIDPNKQRLSNIGKTCATAREMLLTLELPSSEIPDCDVARVEDWLTRHEEGKKALVRMERACERTPEEEALEADALANSVPPDVASIPPYLRARLAWVTRCLTAANTGSARISAVARDVGQLESEYTTAGYDVRRVLNALADGNRYAIFSLIMALVVDTAILFAGFAANAYRGRELGEDHRLVSPDRIADRIRKALLTASPQMPQRAAIQMATLWEPRTADEIARSPFTRKLSLEGVEPRVKYALRLVLDAAGPAFARFVRRNNETYWLLHHNLVALLTEHATTTETSGKSRQVSPDSIDGFYRQSSEPAITPRLAGPRPDRRGDREGNKGATNKPIDLGPEVE